MSANEEMYRKQVEEFLAPLEAVQPVTLPSRRDVPRGRRLVLITAIVAVLGGGAALAGYEVFNPHDATIEVPSNPLTCAGLIGKPAEEAEAYFEERGVEVEWRFDTFGDKVGRTAPSGVFSVAGGHAAEESSPRPGSVVWDILPLGRDSKRVVVRTKSPDDPNSPKVEPPKNC